MTVSPTTAVDLTAMNSDKANVTGGPEGQYQRTEEATSDQIFGDGCPAQPQLPMREGAVASTASVATAATDSVAVNIINDNTGDNNDNNVEQAKCNDMKRTLS